MIILLRQRRDGLRCGYNVVDEAVECERVAVWIVAVGVVVVELVVVVEEAEEIWIEGLCPDGCGRDTVGSLYTLSSDSNSRTPFRGTTLTKVAPGLLFTRRTRTRTWRWTAVRALAGGVNTGNLEQGLQNSQSHSNPVQQKTDGSPYLFK